MLVGGKPLQKSLPAERWSEATWSKKKKCWWRCFCWRCLEKIHLIPRQKGLTKERNPEAGPKKKWSTWEEGRPCLNSRLCFFICLESVEELRPFEHSVEIGKKSQSWISNCAWIWKGNYTLTRNWIWGWGKCPTLFHFSSSSSYSLRVSPPTYSKRFKPPIFKDLRLPFLKIYASYS